MYVHVLGRGPWGSHASRKVNLTGKRGKRWLLRPSSTSTTTTTTTTTACAAAVCHHLAVDWRQPRVGVRNEVQQQKLVQHAERMGWLKCNNAGSGSD